MRIADRKRSRTITNCLFLLVDVVENLFIDCCEQLTKDGLELKHECKRHFNTAFKQVGILRREINKCSITTQESYGDDADKLYEMLMLTFDRAAGDNNVLDEIIEEIKKRPSKLGML